jgi:hypothetical protein
MQYIEPKLAQAGLSTRVWSVKDFAKRHRLNNVEETRLFQLFGPFATAGELLYNAAREPQFR